MSLIEEVLKEVETKNVKQPKRTWDNYRELFEVRKSDRLKLVVGAGARDGFRCIQIREFYLRARDGEWMPGRDGIIIPLTSPLKRQLNDEGLPTIIEPMANLMSSLPDAIEFASTMDLADPEHEVWYPPKA